MAASGGHWKSGHFISLSRGLSNREQLRNELQAKVDETRSQLKSGWLTPTLKVNAGHRREMKKNIARWDRQISELDAKITRRKQEQRLIEAAERFKARGGA